MSCLLFRLAEVEKQFATNLPGFDSFLHKCVCRRKFFIFMQRIFDDKEGNKSLSECGSTELDS